MTPEAHTEILTAIAQKHLGIETLEMRHRDSLDFHDVGVNCLLEALAAAFDAGRQQAEHDHRG
jgi:hypothetical protein